MTDLHATEPEVSAPLRAPGLGRWWLLAAFASVVVVGLAGVIVGPVRLAPLDVVRELVGLESGLGSTDTAIIWEFRLPRVVLALLVGGLLATAGGAYQGTFRNALADPYLLGVAAGAGLGATVAIVSAGVGQTSSVVTLAAFAGAIGAMAITWALGAAGDRTRGPASLVLAGVAVASFFTAVQTFVQQRDQENIRQVYSWILGRLSSAGWDDVLLLLPYAVVSTVVLLLAGRFLDVAGVGDDEARTLGVDPRLLRIVVVAAASMGTAAAVATSGLIAFVGIIVPHTVRLVAGSSYRSILPLSLLFGGSFLAATDLLARTVLAPAELPIGVVTAFFGAPFFVLVLRTSRTGAA